MKFNEFDLNPQVMGGIEDAGFTDCTEVQEQSLVHSLQGKDVAVQSQTGTGKTAAFLITIFQLLLENKEFKGKTALIIAPTRELAVQIERDGNTIGGKTGLKIGSFYGGVGYWKQESLLNNGVDVMIGTPGRLIDLNKSGKLSFAEVGILVIDEADRLFDMGFYPDITWMLRRMDDPDKRVTMLFSATLDQKVRNLAWKYMRNPVEIAVEPEKLTVDLIQQKLYHLGKDEKLPFLLGLLEREQPQNALIFANTKKMVEILAKRLKANGYNCHYIMGDLPQKKRMRIIDDLKQGKLQFLVATDVAARGLHVDDLDMVINFDLPEDCENYVHRIGRTARAGKTGKAVSFACERYVYGLEPIEKLINMKIPVESVSDAMLSADKSADQFIQLERHGERQGSRSSRKRDSRGKPSSPRSKGTGSRPAGRTQRAEKPKSQAQTGKPSGAKGKSQHKPAAKKGAPKRKKDINVNQALGKKPDSSSSMEDRLAYYRKKYGEDFKADKDRSPAEKKGNRKKPGLLKRLFGESRKK